ncbi:MAG: DNA/RNA nuclease SfsA [Ruminococcus sp.]|jgi:sugar fermentation stimulation protein A
MKYTAVTEGVFLSRPNRFIAHIEVNGAVEICHVKNTGRLKELLIPGAAVYLEKSQNPNRKTAYDLIAVKKGTRIINIDSQIPNRLAEEWLKDNPLFPGITCLRREKTYRQSRFDLYFEQGEKKSFMEVKGVTLDRNGTACFPDAPTQRGVKHIQELCQCLQDGYDAYLFFIIQLKGIRAFSPNRETHPAFADALIQAEKQGVKILAYDCIVTPDTVLIDQPVPAILEKQQII